MKFKFPFTERQRRMMDSPARILHIGAGTKTGKSAALFCWLIEGLLRGEAGVFVGPWFFRSKRAFDEIKILLEPWIRGRQCRVNEARLQITAVGGGYLDFVSADNPNVAFGSNYDRVVIDEASRCPSEIFPAALTTISATNGKVRLAFNLELGSKNWAIANLLRVQRLSPDERVRTGEDFMTFPTGGDGLVDPALVEMLRSQMPEPLWRALYLGEIPTSDCSLFRNLDRIFTGRELEEPVFGSHYVMGVDLARKTDFTVVTVMDMEGRAVASERFHQISWSLQVERVALLYRTFRCTKAVVDSTGVGDAVIEQLEEQGLNVEPYIFTLPSRRMLLEELILSCDHAEITIPDTPKFKRYREELESFEYQLDGQTIRYSVPNAMHDDCAFSLALAVHAYRSARGTVLGLLELLKRRAKEIVEGIRDKFGDLINKPEPKPVPVLKQAKPVEPAQVDNFQNWLRTHRAPACAACGNTATTFNELRKVFCNQCHAVDGVQPAKPIADADGRCLVEGCGLKLVMSGGMLRCQNHGQPANQAAVVVGMSFAQLKRRRTGFGRFG